MLSGNLGRELPSAITKSATIAISASTLMTTLTMLNHQLYRKLFGKVLDGWSDAEW
jgi:hypothetical protein